MQLVEAYKKVQNQKFGFKARESFRFSFGDLETSKKLLWEALQEVDKTADIEWLPEYDQVAHWMTDSKGKGLLLSGDVGRGKSNIIMFALPVLYMMKFRKVLKPIHADKLKDLVKDPGFMNRWSYTIDEVGAEPASSDYGVKYHSFMRLINEAEINVKHCLFSTNLSSKEIKEKYDERTLDRIVRLCHVVKFKGKSLRK